MKGIVVLTIVVGLISGVPFGCDIPRQIEYAIPGESSFDAAALEVPSDTISTFVHTNQNLATMARPSGTDWGPLVGMDMDEIRDAHGEPPVLARMRGFQIAREVWVYFPFVDEPTGYYIYFLDGIVAKTHLGPFNGIDDEQVTSWFVVYP